MGQQGGSGRSGDSLDFSRMHRAGKLVVSQGPNVIINSRNLGGFGRRTCVLLSLRFAALLLSG